MKNEPVQVYSLALLSAEPLIWEAPALAEALRALRTPAEVTPSTDAGVQFHLTFPGVVDQPGPAVSVQTASPRDVAFTEKALRQTWDWPEAPAVLERCQHAVFVLDQRARQLTPQVRWGLMRQVVTALIQTANPASGVLALHAHLAQLLVDPQAFLEGGQPGESHDPLCGAANVRFYHVEDQGEGDIVMDSLGLFAFGLPDLQIHFNGADPPSVARLLWHYIYLLFARGEVLQDEDTVEGLDPAERWVCRHERSLTPPERLVIDFNPGQRYAALGRG